MRNQTNLIRMRKVTFPGAPFNFPQAIEMKMKIPFQKHEKRNILMKVEKDFNSPTRETLKLSLTS